MTGTQDPAIRPVAGADGGDGRGAPAPPARLGSGVGATVRYARIIELAAPPAGPAEQVPVDLSGTLIDLARRALLAQVEHAPSYSRGKWRVRVDGVDVFVQQDHPSDPDRHAPVWAPVCADTRRAAEALLADLRAVVAGELARVAADRDRRLAALAAQEAP